MCLCDLDALHNVIPVEVLSNCFECMRAYTHIHSVLKPKQGDPGVRGPMGNPGKEGPKVGNISPA